MKLATTESFTKRSKVMRLAFIKHFKMKFTFNRFQYFLVLFEFDLVFKNLKMTLTDFPLIQYR